MSVRTTISLPDELKARMDALDMQVNWSAEAAKCFEKLLGAVAAKKQEKSMNDVIARLKASKIESEDEDSRLLYNAGRQWAESTASYPELRRAARMHEDDERWGGRYDAYGAPVYIACEIMDVDADRNEGEAFWENAGVKLLDEYYEDDNLIRKFLEGAASVWHEVESKL